MRFYSLAVAAIVGSLFHIVPSSAAVLINVDKSAQRMTVSVDGVPRYVWPVSTGKAGHVTPSGTFKTFRMEEDHYSKEWDDAPMPHSIFFTTEGHAIHGSFDTRHLGTAVSHGCVRLAPQNAATLFALVKQDGLLTTRVVLTGVAPSSAPAVARRKPLPISPPDAETTGSVAGGSVAGRNPVYYDPRTGSYARPNGRPAYAQEPAEEATYAPRPQQPIYGQRPAWGREPAYREPRYTDGDDDDAMPQYTPPPRPRSLFPFMN